MRLVRSGEQATAEKRKNAAKNRMKVVGFIVLGLCLFGVKLGKFSEM